MLFILYSVATVFCCNKKPRPQRELDTILKPPWVPTALKDVYAQ